MDYIDDDIEFDAAEEEKRDQAKYQRFRIMGNMAPFNSPDELLPYIEQGIIEWKDGKPISRDEEWWEYLRIKQTLVERFFKKIESIVVAQSEEDSNIIVKDIIQECRVICYDESSQRAFLGEKIKELAASIHDIKLIGKEARSRIPYETPIEQFIWFAENGTIRAMPGELPGVADWISEAAKLAAIDKLKAKLQKSKNTNKTKLKAEVSYTWLTNPDRELPELHQKMIDAELIAPDTDLQNFIKVFKGKPIEEIVPIKWHDDNTTELLYFIRRLEETGQIAHTKKTNYKRMVACIVCHDGNPFQANFSELMYQVKNHSALSVEKQNRIDNVLRDF